MNSSKDNAMGILNFAYQFPVSVWALTVIYVLIFTTTLVANLITAIYYMIHRRSSYMSVNPYVLSLLIADVLWPLFNIPHNIVHTWTSHWVFGALACHVLPYLQVALPEVIALTLCAIAIERYFTIIQPFRSNPMLKPPIAAASIAFTWLLPFVGNFFLIFCHDLNRSGNFCIPTSLFDGAIQANDIMSFKVIQSAVVLVGIPALLFPFCYGRIILRVFRSQVKKAKGQHTLMPAQVASPISKKTSLGSLLKNHNGIHRLPAIHASAKINSLKRRSNSEKRTLTVTIISLAGQVAHFTCWAPIVIFQLWHMTNGYPEMSSLQVLLFKVLLVLAAANPAWNSLSYTAVLRHRSQPQNKATRRMSSFNLLVSILKHRSVNRGPSSALLNHRMSQISMPRTSISNRRNMSLGANMLQRQLTDSSIRFEREEVNLGGGGGIVNFTIGGKRLSDCNERIAENPDEHEYE